MATVFLVLSTMGSSAKYVADGQIEGNVCSNYLIFEACHFVEIDAMRDTNGKVYTVLEKEFENVDEFHEQSSMCFFRLKHDNWYESIKSWVGWIGYKLGYDWEESFLTADKNGGYVRVDPEYLRFKCIKRE
jgi:hypothetical protein